MYMHQSLPYANAHLGTPSGSRHRSRLCRTSWYDPGCYESTSWVKVRSRFGYFVDYVWMGGRWLMVFRFVFVTQCYNGVGRGVYPSRETCCDDAVSRIV